MEQPFRRVTGGRGWLSKHEVMGTWHFGDHTRPCWEGTDGYSEVANFFKRLYFLEHFSSIAQLRGRCRELPVTPCSPRAQPPPLSTSLSRGSTVVMADDPARTRDNAPKSIVRLWVHSRGCTLCGSGQVCNDTYPSLQPRTQ